MLVILFQILNALLMLHALYFAFFALWGLFRKRKEYKETDAQRHFAVLIPARNEELVIGNLAESIAKADYPPELLDTYVVVNNTTDNTAAAAEAHGAKIMECNVPVKSKADVLRFAFDRLRGNANIDTYVIFDADNVVAKDFFKEINKAHAEGFQSTQGRRTGKNLRPTMISSCYEIYYSMQNAFFNHSRNAAKLSAAINGTGWTIDRSVIDAHGFDMVTIAEDHEFTLWCAMNDVPIAYCCNALVYDEFADNLRVSVKQRLRWSLGMLQNFRRYEWRLLKQALQGSFQCFDVAMVNILPLVVLISIIAMGFAYAILDIPLPLITFIIGLIATFWTGLSLGALLSVVKSGTGVKNNIKGVIGFPLFIIIWAPILLVSLFKRDMEWAPIKHDQVVSIEDRQKEQIKYTNEEDPIS